VCGTIEALVQFVKFDCSKCGQNILAPVDGEGVEIECPDCKEKLTIPTPGEAKLRTVCPRCSQKLKVPTRSVATEVKCPVCMHAFQAAVKERAKISFPKLRRLSVSHLIAGALCVVVLTLGFYWAHRRSPEYSVDRIGNAFTEHDYVAFQKYVDVDSVVSRIIDDLALLAGKDETWAMALAQFLAKPRLVDETKLQICRLVESGSLGDTNKALGLFNRVKGAQDYLGIMHERREGKIAVLGLGFTNVHRQLSRIVEVRMRNKGGYWQVAELSNFSELMQTAKMEEQERIAKRNGPVLAKIAKCIEIVDFRKEIEVGEYGVGHKMIIHMRVKNTGTVPLMSYSAVISPKDATGKSLKELRVRSEGMILPGRTFIDSWEFEVNKFIPSDVSVAGAVIAAQDVQFIRVQPEGSTELVVERAVE
jgi:DNA-directed RNA polymerase subunit RPC12/RpoP